MALPLVACQKDATQLVVLVSTDYPVPAELAFVRARISNLDGEEISASEFTLTAAPDPSDPTRFVIPFSFGVVPIDDDASRRIVIDADGMAPDRRVRLTRRAITGFLSEQSLLLPMFLARSCEDVECGEEDQTCTEIGCVSSFVDPGGLVAVRPGEELLDASAPDARVDASMDASTDAPADVSTDASGDAGSGPRFERLVGSSVGCAMGSSTGLTLAQPVPVGDILALSVFYRDVSGGAIGAADSRGNTYVVVDERNTNNPMGGLIYAEVTSALSVGDTVTVSHPAAAVVSIVADQLAGVSAPPVASEVTQTRGAAVSSPVTTAVPGLVYAVHANMNNRTFMNTSVFSGGTSEPSSCPVAFGDLDHRTFHLDGDVGTHTLSGTYAMPEQHLTVIGVFPPAD